MSFNEVIVVSYKKIRVLTRIVSLVRPGVIETPTNPWQGLVIPLNHGRIFIFAIPSR